MTLRVAPEIRRMIDGGRPASEIREQANLEGMTDLTQHAVQLAKEGKITLEKMYLVKQS
ncbi:MAG: hypothetical protein HY308_05250 [Gammaproteobacteria bacterium]|nr:hypothetical protein [Gammaproteobacteria bacterium]